MKKGFTLIELMAVIILLGVLGLIATVSVTNVIKENKGKACNIQLNNIISSAKAWASKNTFSLPTTEGETVVITIQDLKDAGFLDDSIINPKTNKEFSNSTEIRIKRVSNNYTYELGVEC